MTRQKAQEDQPEKQDSLIGENSQLTVQTEHHCTGENKLIFVELAWTEKNDLAWRKCTTRQYTVSLVRNIKCRNIKVYTEQEQVQSEHASIRENIVAQRISKTIHHFQYFFKISKIFCNLKLFARLFAKHIYIYMQEHIYAH